MSVPGFLFFFWSCFMLYQRLQNISMLPLYLTLRLISIRPGGKRRSSLHQHALTPALFNALLHFINGQRVINISAGEAYWSDAQVLRCLHGHRLAGEKEKWNHNSQEALHITQVGERSCGTPTPPLPRRPLFLLLFSPAATHVNLNLGLSSWIMVYFQSNSVLERRTTAGGENIVMVQTYKSEPAVNHQRCCQPPEGVVKTAASTGQCWPSTRWASSLFLQLRFNTLSSAHTAKVNGGFSRDHRF